MPDRIHFPTRASHQLAQNAPVSRVATQNWIYSFPRSGLMVRTSFAFRNAGGNTDPRQVKATEGRSSKNPSATSLVTPQYATTSEFGRSRRILLSEAIYLRTRRTYEELISPMKF
jgi:hypothetical protein